LGDNKTLNKEGEVMATDMDNHNEGK